MTTPSPDSPDPTTMAPSVSPTTPDPALVDLPAFSPGRRRRTPPPPDPAPEGTRVTLPPEQPAMTDGQPADPAGGPGAAGLRDRVSSTLRRWKATGRSSPASTDLVDIVGLVGSIFTVLGEALNLWSTTRRGVRDERWVPDDADHANVSLPIGRIIERRLPGIPAGDISDAVTAAAGGITYLRRNIAGDNDGVVYEPDDMTGADE